MTKKAPKKLIIEMMQSTVAQKEPHYWYRLKAANGEILMGSETLENPANCWINCWKLKQVLTCKVTFRNHSSFAGVKGCEM